MAANSLWEQVPCGSKFPVGAGPLWQQIPCGSRSPCGSKFPVGAEPLWEQSLLAMGATGSQP